MTTLVTGASGFVGAALVDALVRRGERVIGVDRAAAPDGQGRPPSAFRAIDLRQSGGLDPILAGEPVDRLVIGAAMTADAARERSDPAAIVAVNVGAVADAVRAAAAAGVARVLYLGSAAVYGDSGRGADTLVEDVTPLRPRSLYGITKQAGEATALRLSDTFGIDLVAARLGTCFGPFERDTGARDTLSAPYQILRLAEAGNPVRLPRPGRRDWLYVRDTVAGIMALLDAPVLPHRVYNVAAGFEWTLAEFCERLAARRPGFDWALSDPADATVNLFDDYDRVPMSNTRILADTAFRPRFDLDAVADDFLGKAR